MLSNFFSLNPGFKVVSSEDEFLELLRHSDALRDILYQHDRFAPPRPENRIRDKRFTNVSFAKTVMDAIEFTRCTFVDCLFIGTSFTNCEFHDCVFEGCNPYKASFSNTYIDPACFAKMLDPHMHSNIGIWLFQQLLHNSAECRQPRFTQTAHYLFHKWKRYQLTYDYKKKHLTGIQYFRRWLPSILYDHLAGYGIRLLPLVRLTCTQLLVLTVLNYLAWPEFGMYSSTIDVGTRSCTTSFYYTVITITTLGYGDLTPTTKLGMNLASVESLFGIVWLGLIANTIIKRVLK